MILKALTLENFKGIREPVRIEFAPLTLLFGPNSAGKSTVFQALQYACGVLSTTSAENYAHRSCSGLDLGGFRDFVNGHDIGKAIVLKFDLALPNSGVRPDYELIEHLERAEDDWDLARTMPTESISYAIAEASIAIRVEWDCRKGAACISQYDVTLNGIRFGTISYRPEESEARITWLNYCHPLLVEVDPDFRDSYDKWLEGFDSGIDPADIEGVGSGTRIEAFAEDFNEAPWLGKALPIRIKGLKQALPPVFHPMNLDLSKGMRAFDLSQPTDEAISYHIACAIISEGFLSPAALLLDFLRNAIFVGPIRDIPERHADFRSRATDFPWRTGLAAWDTLLRADPPFVAEVNAWMSDSDKLDCGYVVDTFQFRELPLDHPLVHAMSGSQRLGLGDIERGIGGLPIITRVRLREKATGIEVTPQDVGAGISQVLPVVVAALQHSPGYVIREQIIAIEQPELHIHPALQVRLGDLFAEQSRDGRRCFILETHSEHLMLRCLRLVREAGDGGALEGVARLKADDIAVNVFEPTDGGPRVHRIRVDKDGEFLDPWPRGFFRERIKELYGDDL